MTSVQRCLGAAAVLALVLAWSPSGLAQGKGDKPGAGQVKKGDKSGAGKADKADKADKTAPGVDPAKLEEAKKHMVAGAALYNNPSGHKCEEAYVEFNKAYELTGSLNALKNRAVCALELEKDGEALLDYKKVLEGMGDKLDADDRAQIENDTKALESAIAWVTFKLDVPKAALTDVRSTSRGASIKNRYDLASNSVKLGVHPGDHTFTVKSDDGKERTWTVTLANGSTQEHAFELTKDAAAPPAPTVTKTERPVPISVKVMLGVTGAFAVGTGVMMGLASVARDDYEKTNGKTSDKALLDGKRNNVILMNGVADGLLGGTVLAAGGTLVLFLLRPTVQVEERKTTGLYIAPAVSPSGVGAFAGGHF